MLIPLGILAGSGGGLDSDYELISSTILGADAATVEFTSIPSGYKHLQVRWTAKTTSTVANVEIRFNGITTSSYARHTLYSDTSSVVSEGSSSQTRIVLLNSASRSTTSNAFAGGIMDILDYSSSTKNTTVRALYGQKDALNNAALATGFLNNTASITSVLFFLASSNYATNTRFSIYGIRG